jgi:ATP-dependent DNA helicase Rep
VPHRFADYAILYRGNHQARLFEEALREAKIPYQLSGGQSFFDKAEIKDLTAYLRLIANPDDDPAFIRAVTTPRRGIGAGTLEKLGDHAGQRHISLFAAAFETVFRTHLPARQLEPLTAFCDFINRIADRAEKEAAGSSAGRTAGRDSI